MNKRRNFLILSAIGLTGGAGWLQARNQEEPNKVMNESTKDILSKLESNPSSIVPLELSRERWINALSEESFYVLREEGTERPFTSALNDEKRDGVYVCAGCSLALFSSESKFDSGTGWPSFYDAIEGRVETKTDYKLIIPRTEYHCARCGGHQGHVFKDGPRPTGLRYCNNGVALKFIPNEA